MTYHQPVLAQASVDILDIKSDGIYVDVTFGGGGHSKLILEQLGPKGKLFGFDQDADAKANAIDDPRFQFVPSNFRYLKRFLRLYGVEKVDGILADLGVSSHQLDVAERGFSYRFDAALDMRMNQEQEQSAVAVLAEYSADDLQRVLGEYGEVRNARTLAQHLVEERKVRPIRTIQDLLSAVDPLIRGQRLRYLSQVFQALRIEVNDEMGALQDFLAQSIEVLKTGGILSVITYHSLEDRLVKNYLKAGNAEGKYDKDFYGNIYRPFKVLTKKAQLPTEQEIRENSRARSAKLRAGQKQ
jgi:16S rRNA (cytosine1402-N4)-methyltransferase